MKTTLTLSPEEIEAAIYGLLESRGYRATSFRFKIDKGFPGSRDPRENSQPSFTGCEVEAENLRE